MPVGYDFNGRQLAGRRLNPQLSHMGMLEINIESLVDRQAKEDLMIGLKSVRLPTPRKSPRQTVNILNGNINYPGRPGPLGDLTVVIHDYINGRQRDVLHLLYDLVYDESTGLGQLPSDIKTTAYLVLFGPNGITSRHYFFEGIWLTSDPAIPNIDYSTGTLVTMEAVFSVDFMENQPVIPLPQ